MSSSILGKTALKRMLTDALRKGPWSDRQIDVMIESLWREQYSMRTSGFAIAGGTDAEMFWNDATRTFTIQPLDYEASTTPGIKFAFYTFAYKLHYHKKYTPHTVQLPNEEGLYCIYFDQDDETKEWELTYAKNPTDELIRDTYLNRVVTAWIYWNYDLQEAIYFGDSRHGSEWNPQMHWMLHQTINSQRQSGLALTNVTYDGEGDENGDYQFGISAGELWHDDIFAETDAVAEADSLPVWYFNSAGDPRFVTADSGKKFLNTGTGRVAHQSLTGGLAEAPDQHFVVYHLFATNCTLHPHISVMGQASFDTLGAAVGTIEAEVATLRQDLPHANLMHIASFVLQTSDAFTNGGKAIIVYTSATEDVFVSDTGFDTETGILTLHRSANRPPLKQPLDISTIIHNTIINEGDTIINIINEAAQQIVMSGIGCCKESFIIEHTTAATTTQLSRWFVLAYNQLVGEFKATVMVRDKDDDTVHTVESILSFDYTDPSAEVSIQNDIITEAITSLVLGIDANHQLYATVTTAGETASDAKRIHFCFERCVLSVRHKLMEASGTFELGADAELTKYIDLVADPITFELGAAGVLQGDGNLSANISFTLEAEAALDETGIMNATVTMSLNVTATLTAFVPEPEFGLLYNFAVIENTKQVAPTGYRAANMQDVIDLITYLGGETAAGGPLKALQEWTTPNTGATNGSGFSGLPAGYRNELGAFLSKLTKARIWIDNR